MIDDIPIDGAGRPGGESGVVLRGTGGVWSVELRSGPTVEAALRGRLKLRSSLKLAVGDDVILARDHRGSHWAIDHIQPRRSVLARRAPGGAYGDRVIAANVEQVIVVFAAARPEPHLRMIDRFLVIAESNELAARLVVNKIDLADTEATRERFADYVRAGYAVHFTSKLDPPGLSALHEALAGHRSVITGPSGVGKSSLLNTLYPGLNLRVGATSEAVQKGRHTTVGASMHPLPGGGYVIDTPGLREVGLWELPVDSLDQCFPEFRPLLGKCRFSDCTHRSEPGCAVRAAAETGEVSAPRYDSYLKLHEELITALPQ
jgi:ribosome biogenesis GTPase